MQDEVYTPPNRPPLPLETQAIVERATQLIGQSNGRLGRAAALIQAAYELDVTVTVEPDGAPASTNALTGRAFFQQWEALEDNGPAPWNLSHGTQLIVEVAEECQNESWQPAAQELDAVVILLTALLTAGGTISRYCTQRRDWLLKQPQAGES